MQIDPHALSEKNYTGSRLILIENEKVDELQKKLTDCQKEINPILTMLSKDYYPAVDPIYQEVAALQQKINPLKEKIAEINFKFKGDVEKIEAVEQRATLIKNKIQPLIMKEMEGKLSEFEIARHTTVKDEKIYVEVFDEIEEKIKMIRANKAVK